MTTDNKYDPFTVVEKTAIEFVKQAKLPQTQSDLIQAGFVIAKTFFNNVDRIASALERIADNTKDC